MKYVAATEMMVGVFTLFALVATPVWTARKIMAAVVLGLAALYPADAADGGGAMKDLKDLDALKAIVEADFGNPRLLVLLSPT